MGKERLLLIDSHALVHRAYHAYPPLTTSKKELVNAVYGFSVMLLNAIKKFHPEYLACAFDEKGPTFREKQFVGYKAQRIPMDKELEDQLDRVREVVNGLNIPSFSAKGYEADDIIGSLVQMYLDGKYGTKDIEIIVVSGDRDLLQLLDKNVYVALPGKSFADARLWDIPAFEEKYGFNPKYYVDYKGLTGDPSDNIPGVKGIGEKSAAELVKMFKTIEEIYKNIDKVPEKFKKKLEGQEEIAMASKKLSLIVRNVKLKFDIEKCRVAAYDRDKIVALFRELEFSSLLKLLPPTSRETARRLAKAGSSSDKVVRGKAPQPKIKTRGKSEAKTRLKTVNTIKGFSYTIVDNEKSLCEMLRSLEKEKEIVIDAESDMLNQMRAKMVGFSISDGKRCWYIPTRKAPNDESFVRAQMAKYGKSLKRLIELIEDPNIRKIGHNLKFDKHIFLNEGIDMQGLYFDTLIAAYLINVGSQNLGLKSLAFTKLGIEMTEFDEIFTNKPYLYKEDVDTLAKYCCMDAYVTGLLKRKLEEELREIESSFKFDRSLLPKRNKKWSIFYDLEMPLVDVLVEMERNGVLVNEKALERLDRVFAKSITEIEKQIYKGVGHEFNPGSPSQLAHVLFDELNLPFKRKGKTGYSTGDAILRKIIHAHPVVPLVRQYREVTKLRSTYVKGLLQLLSDSEDVSGREKRVHTSFNQTVAATGRLSSSNPNLQNIPIRTELGNEIRRCFVAPEGYVLVSLDYSQIELRVMAHVSKDKNLMRIFRKGIDVHKAAASTIFNVPVEKVTKEQRRVGKTVNFAVMYGMSEFGLSDLLGIPEEMARVYIQRYFDQFPAIKDYTNSIVRQIEKYGYVETLFGRRRNFVYDTGYHKMRGLIREAVNTPMQGTAADIMKLAMIEVDKLIKGFPFEVKMILQVHDELVFEVELEKREKALPLTELYTDKNLKVFVPKTIKCMEEVVNLDVPLDVDAEVGYNWADGIEVEPDSREE